jgi:multidrug transporter EmrE-like cation transporter
MSDITFGISEVFLLIIFIVLLECLAQGCLKQSYITNDKKFLCVSVLSYLVICLLLVKTYAYKGVGIVNLIWSCLSILFVIATGIIFFHEELTKNDMIGTGLILTGLYFVYMKDHIK